jgi:hypothetical protein
VRYDHTNTTSTAAVSFALAEHRPCREAGGCLVSSATHHGDDQYIDATWLRWVAFNQVTKPANPTRGWLCTARLGPCARNSDSGSAEIESSMQTAIFLLIERWTPGCPLPPAQDTVTHQSPRHPPKASRDSPVAIHRAQHYAD